MAEVTTSLRLLKNPASSRFGEGHEFTRAVETSNVSRASAPGGRSQPQKRVFREPASFRFRSKAVSDVKVRGGKGVLNGTPFFILIPIGK